MILGFLVGGLLLATGLVAVLVLNANSQDLRQQASGEAYIHCDRANECPLGQKCVSSKCESIVICDMSNECPVGQECVSSQCVPKPTVFVTPVGGQGCMLDEGCPEGYFCSNYQCKPESEEYGYDWSLLKQEWFIGVPAPTSPPIVRPTAAAPTGGFFGGATRSPTRTPTSAPSVRPTSTQIQITFKCNLFSPCPKGSECSNIAGGTCVKK